MSPAAPRWCDQHQRQECTRQRSRGRGDCHAPAIIGTSTCRMHSGKTVAKARADAMKAWAATPGPSGVTPMNAIAAMLELAWHRSVMLGDLLRQRAEAQGPDAFAGGLGQAEAAERDRVARFATIAAAMGLAEHQARLARQFADELCAFIDGVLDDLDLSASQKDRVPEVVPRRLRALTFDGDG